MPDHPLSSHGEFAGGRLNVSKRFIITPPLKSPVQAVLRLEVIYTGGTFGVLYHKWLQDSPRPYPVPSLLDSPIDSKRGGVVTKSRKRS